MIPCKKNKCLMLPVCKTKERIKCDDLLQYIRAGTFADIRETFGHIKEIEPATSEILRGYTFYDFTMQKK